MSKASIIETVAAKLRAAGEKTGLLSREREIITERERLTEEAAKFAPPIAKLCHATESLLPDGAHLGAERRAFLPKLRTFALDGELDPAVAREGLHLLFREGFSHDLRQQINAEVHGLLKQKQTLEEQAEKLTVELKALQNSILA